MKKLLSLTAISILVLAGCSNAYETNLKENNSYNDAVQKEIIASEKISSEDKNQLIDLLKDTQEKVINRDLQGFYNNKIKVQEYLINLNNE